MFCVKRTHLRRVYGFIFSYFQGITMYKDSQAPLILSILDKIVAQATLKNLPIQEESIILYETCIWDSKERWHFQFIMITDVESLIARLYFVMLIL